MLTERLKVLYLPKPDHTQLVFTPYWWNRLCRYAEVVEWDHAVPCTSENLVVYYTTFTEFSQAERIGEFDVLATAWGSPRLTDEVLQEARRLQLIAHAGAGFYGYHRIGELLVKAVEAVSRGVPFEGEVALDRYERIA